MDDEPRLTPLAENALKMQEHFRTLVEQGFTERQALYLLGVLMAELIRSNP